MAQAAATLRRPKNRRSKIYGPCYRTRSRQDVSEIKCINIQQGKESNSQSPLFVENQLTNDMVSPLNDTKCRRFINLPVHAVCDIISRGRFAISYIRTAFHRADLVTKPVSRVKLWLLKEIVNMIHISRSADKVVLGSIAPVQGRCTTSSGHFTPTYVLQ